MSTSLHRFARHSSTLVLVALSPLLAVGCVGTIGDDASSGSGGSGAATGETTGTTTNGVTTGTSVATGAGGMGQGGAGTGGPGTTSSSDAASTSVASTSVASTSVASTSASTGGVTPAEMVCARWKADRANLSEGTWSGNVAACNPGDISADGRANALKLVNLYRYMAGLPEVTDDAAKNQNAEACALMMTANNQLSHSPPTNWKCYTSQGASAAGTSNISSGPGVMSIDMYMSDFGNDTTIGHRRWILSNSLGPIGLGSTNAYSCLQVIGGSGNAGKAYQPWPPDGPIPIQAFTASFQSIDSTGWTIQSDSINLSGAVVKVTDNGVEKAMSVTQLAGGYGSSQAIKMIPNGWTSQAGHTYSVSVTGTNPPISYDVEVVSCP